MPWDWEKTVQAIALMLARPGPKGKPKTNLIIVPLSLIKQWSDEIKKHAKASHALTVLKYHGPGVVGSIRLTEKMKYDVVITNYETVSREWARREDAEDSNRPMGGKEMLLLNPAAKFHRVILDEAHIIKNRTTKVSNGTHAIESKSRLCMTGTPLMNEAQELFSPIRFLRIKPYNDWAKFKKEISRSIKSKLISDVPNGRKQ